jgi:hypothetical protein
MLSRSFGLLPSSGSILKHVSREHSESGAPDALWANHASGAFVILIPELSELTR